MQQAVIVEAIRTPIGRRQGQLMTWRPDDLAAHLLQALFKRVDIDPALVEEVLLGCVMQVGEQALNIARKATLMAGLPDSVSATTVDYQCGSGLRSVQIAAAQIQAGISEVVVAGGVESMTRVPLGSSGQIYGAPLSDQLLSRYALVSNGISSDLIAERWRLTREEMDEFSLRSHHLAWTATQGGRFSDEIIPIPYPDGGRIELMERDEGIRADTNAEKLASLRPAFTSSGPTTAASSSQISDGAAVLLLMNARRAAKLGLTPMASIGPQVSVGTDPILGLTGPIEATQLLLKRSGLTIDDIDLFEINEAFASVVLAWERELRPDMTRVNVNGGAIALGHPLGCSGARQLTTLVHEMRRRGVGRGLVSLCCNAGLGVGLLVDLVV
jgi:acetyl-CoA acyltransferase